MLSPARRMLEVCQITATIIARNIIIDHDLNLHIINILLFTHTHTHTHTHYFIIYIIYYKSLIRSISVVIDSFDNIRDQRRIYLNEIFTPKACHDIVRK